MANLAGLVKRAALEAVQTGQPAGLFFGEVVGTAPLRVLVESRMLLDERQLFRGMLVRDFDVEMTVAHSTEQADGGAGYGAYDAHAHAYAGRKVFRVHLGLEVGEKVILIRMQGGQRFYVLDRVREEETA